MVAHTYTGHVFHAARHTTRLEVIRRRANARTYARYSHIHMSACTYIYTARTRAYMCRCVHLRRKRVREKDGEKGGREKEPAECGTNSYPIHPNHAGCVCFRMPNSRRPATSFFILFTGEHTASFFWLRAFLCDSNVPHEIKITLEWCSRLLVFRSAFLYGSLSFGLRDA